MTLRTDIGWTWPTYNEQLVKRGEFLLDFDWIQNWDKELQEMNRGKVGSPYRFPESLIQIQAVWTAKKMPCRTIEGMTRRLVELSCLPKYNDYSTISRRVNAMKLDLEVPQGEKLHLFADGTGFRVIESGEYLREKYGKKNRRWVQVVMLADPNTNEPVSFNVHIIQQSEVASAKEQLHDLIDDGYNIDEFGGDGGFDEIDLWNWLDHHNIKSRIKPDWNAKEKSESVMRNFSIKFRRERGHDEWKKKMRYGRRWNATEGIFSSIKRMFGEELHATSEAGLLQEAGLMFWAYQKMKRYGES